MFYIIEIIKYYISKLIVKPKQEFPLNPSRRFTARMRRFGALAIVTLFERDASQERHRPQNKKFWLR